MRRGGTARSRFRGWSFALAMVLATVLLWLALRGVAWQDLVSGVRRARPEWLLLATLVLSASYLARGLRWSVLLRAEGAIKTSVVISATWIGYLANGFLPARAGEPIRAVLISRHSKITVSAALATAFTERIVDAMVLALIGLGALVLVPGLPAWVQNGAWAMAGAALVALLAVLVAPRFAMPLTDKVRGLPLGPRWSVKLAGWVGQFLHGLSALGTLRCAVPFLALTAVVWCIDTVAALLVARAVNVEIAFTEILVLLAALGLSSAAPSTPGYVGIYQFVAVSVLEPFDIARSDALVFIFAFQAIVYAIIVIAGAAAFWMLGRITRMATRQLRAETETAATSCTEPGREM